MTEPRWNITFPITKAEQRNGRHYLTGIATGPGIDATMERMDPECVANFAAQVNMLVEKGEPLLFINAHAEDGVFRDLGHLTKAWLTPEAEMGVEVELNDIEDDSAAKKLWRSIAKGGQWGMSVAGRVVKFADEWVETVGMYIRTYYEVLLSEVSVTSRPAYTPSLGTVMAKAIRDAAKAESDAKEGENLPMGKKLQGPEQETTEPAAEAEKSDKIEATEGSVEATTKDDGDAAESDVTAVVDGEVASDVVEDVERSADEETEKTRRPSKKRILAAISVVMTALGDLSEEDPGSEDNVSDQPEKSVSDGDEESTVEKSDEALTVLKTRLTELESANKSLTDRVKELESQPADQAPDLVYRASETLDELRRVSPGDRLRLLLRSQSGE